MRFIGVITPDSVRKIIKTLADYGVLAVDEVFGASVMDADLTAAFSDLERLPMGASAQIAGFGRAFGEPAIVSVRIEGNSYIEIEAFSEDRRGSIVDIYLKRGDPYVLATALAEAISGDGATMAILERGSGLREVYAIALRRDMVADIGQLFEALRKGQAQLKAGIISLASLEPGDLSNVRLKRSAKGALRPP